jgi:multiple sugar transport system ATP-binding protein
MRRRARAVLVVANVVEELGSDAFLYATLLNPRASAEGQVHSEQIIARVEPRRAPHKGDHVCCGSSRGVSTFLGQDR